MAGKGKVILFTALTALVFALFFLSLPRERAGDVDFAALEALEARAEALTLTEGLVKKGDRLLIEGEEAPFDAAKKTFYIPMTGVETPHLSWSNGNQTALVACGGDFDYESARREGTAIPLLVEENGRAERFSAVFTGLPAVNIAMESDNATFGAYSKAVADVTVFDPVHSSTYAVTAAQAKVSYRGASSRYFNKKSYNLKLYDPRGGDSGYELLGLRRDNEWILKSLFTDPNRIREKLALTLWNEIAAGEEGGIPSASMEFCEVFLDEEYLGVYGLMTPIDPKDYGFSEQKDVLFKAATFDILTEDASLYPKRELKANGIKFPTVWRQNLWEGVLWYVNYFYKENPAENAAALSEHLSLENFVDYALFHSFIAARDNNFSNTFYLTRYDDAGGYEVLKFPWDLDMTFGNKWSGGWPDMSAFYEETISEVAFPHDMNVFLESYPEEIVPLIQERYENLRGSVYSDDHALTLARAYLDELLEGGALAREQARYPEMTVYSDISDIERFLTEHIACLDERIKAGTNLEDH